MKFCRMPIEGAYVITPEPAKDERGRFTRVWSAAEFEAAGLPERPTQTSISGNPQRGTLRGMHYQSLEAPEVKMVSCIRGIVFDVMVDMRPGSPTYRCSYGVELSADNGVSIYIPAHVAHGFLTLADHSDILYQISGDYVPSAARGVRWNDPAFDIEWPAQPTLLSDRDSHYPDVVV
jgi:dTDP-4-dehydrorhamnose 3,5-epimerase